MIGALTKQWAEDSNLVVEYLPTTESTNDLAKADPFRSPRIVVTEFQTLGRGRGQNSWSSPKKGTSLLSTWVLPTKSLLQPIAAPLVGLALIRAATLTWPEVEWGLKAPNDLFIGEKKVAGILLETVSQGERSAATVGLGMNFFAKPEVEGATAVVETISEEQIKAGLKVFLDHWIVELGHALERGQNEALTPSEANEILAALNRNPFYKEKFLRVHPDGSLESSLGKTDWSQI